MFAPLESVKFRVAAFGLMAANLNALA